MPVSELFVEIYHTTTHARYAMGDHFDQKLMETMQEENIDEKLVYSIVKNTDNYLEYMTMSQAIALTILSTFQQTPVYLDANLDDDFVVRKLMLEALRDK